MDNNWKRLHALIDQIGIEEALAKLESHSPSDAATCSASCETLEPCRIREDGTPEFDGTRWESGMHLMFDLVMERLPEPCWIRNGRSAMKINPCESRVMGRGIMLGSDVTEFTQNEL